MRITISFLALLAAIVGLFMYVFATNGKIIHIGDTLFWTGTLATLISGPVWSSTVIRTTTTT